SSCPKNSLKYRFNPFGGKKSLPAEADKKEAANSRRSFLSTGATVALSLPAVSAVAQAADGRGHRGHRAHRGGTPVTPPGSISLSRFKDTCTACHICVVKCPSQVLVPAGLEFGFGYLLRPYLSYKSHYCNYECTVCSDVCPVHALKPLTVEEKKTTQVGIATFHKGRCIVHTEGTDCGACSEHCPTQAVHMVPYSGVLTIPKVEEELCIGCGGCESICPVKPLRAIVVQANEEHRLVKMPEVEEVKEIEIEDFGF
ncbi:MAG: 4Fe-4S dicluster domain-containing protein, partial [Tannerellaceae bacterium]|nr:4Fe-4S dicluster domain-containing protein [Tannerellaceae bacterium]